MSRIAWAWTIFIQMKVVVPKLVRRVLRIEGKATATKTTVALRAEREVAVKKIIVSRIVLSKSILMKVLFVPKEKREAIEEKVYVVPIAEAIELNVAKEISLGKCATAALRTNILTELVIAQMIVGRDITERDLVAIDVQKDI